MKPLYAALLASAFFTHPPRGAAQTFRTYDAQLITDTNVQEVVSQGGPESRPPTRTLTGTGVPQPRASSSPSDFPPTHSGSETPL